MCTFVYQDNIGLEDIYKEYKEFNFFNNGINFSNDDAISLLENNCWIFNKFVNKCITPFSLKNGTLQCV